jgi:uncharacterized protein YjiS (DUF1127 family)
VTAQKDTKEIIMSRLLSSTATCDESAHAHIPASLLAAANRWWAGYTRWRLHKAAIAQLRSMSDRQLADIGVSRSEIEYAVSGKRDRAVSPIF